jgi:DNA-binding transcriptional regulator LsrR (DeoR family)
VSERQIAITIGVSRSTVGEYLRRAGVIGITWPVPEGVDDAELERLWRDNLDENGASIWMRRGGRAD